MLKWEGVMPAVTTKFTNQNTLDINMFEKNIKAQIEAGVHGIILGGTLEASTLTLQEKEVFGCQRIDDVATHIYGNPVHVVSGGGPNLIGNTMRDKRQYSIKG